MRRLISDVCLFVLLPIWLLIGVAQAQFNSFPPGVFTGRAPLDPAPGGASLLLDSLSATAVFASSTRKLRAAYAGNAMQVQTNGGTTGNIGFTGTDLDTTALATLVGSNDGGVNVWNDQSASATDASESPDGSQSNQPLVRIGGSNQIVNFHVCPRFTDNANNLGTLPYANSLMEITAGTTAQPFSIAAAFQFSNLAATGGGLTDGVAAPRVVMGGLGNPITAYQMFAGGSAISGGTPDATTVHTFIGVFNGASSVGYIDGVSTITGNPGSSAYGPSTFRIGANVRAFYCELIIFNSALGTTDRATIHTSWQTYWGSN